MSFLILSLAVAALAFLLRLPVVSPLKRARPGALLLAYLLPAAFLTWALWAFRNDATRFRFALLGYGFRGAPGQSFTIDVGGQRKKSDVWVSALAEGGNGPAVAGRLTFLPPKSDAARGLVRFQSQATAAGFFAVRLPEEEFGLLAAVPLAAGDRLTVAERTWEIRGSWFGTPSQLIDGGGRVVPLPGRASEVPLLAIKVPVLRPLPASLETYPLAWLEKRITGTLPPQRPQAFLFREPGLFGPGKVLLAAPAGEVTLERGGQPLLLPQQADLPTGSSYYILSFPLWDEQGFKARGLRDRRSFRVSAGQRSFALELDTKEIYALPWRHSSPEDPSVGLADLVMETAGGSGGPTPLKVAVSFGDWQFADKSLHFTHASQRLAGEALAVFDLPPDLGRGEESFRAATPRGRSRGQLGQPLWLGGDSAAAVQIDVLRPAVTLGLLALVLGLCKVSAGAAVRLTNAHLIFAAVLETLLTLRILLGLRAWAMPPFSEEAFRLAMIAWSLLPWSFLAASLPVATSYTDDESRGRRLLLVASGMFFSMVWCWRWSPSPTLTAIWLFSHLGVAAVPFLRYLACFRESSLAETIWNLLRRLAAMARLLATVGRTVARYAGGLLRHLPESLRDLGHRLVDAIDSLLGEARPWHGWAFGLLVVRLVLLVLGAKESLPLPAQRLALTLLHVPLALVLEAAYLTWLWRRLEEEWRLTWRDFLPSVSFLLGTWVLPAFLVSDLGLALLNVPVFLIALTGLAFAAARRMRAAGESESRLWLASLLSGGMLLIFVLVVGSPVVARLGTRAVATLQSGEVTERNFLRLLAFASPEELSRIASRPSEGLAVMNAAMETYTSRPFRDCRYFTSELSPHLRATVLREHTPSVLLAAEWGIGGTLGALLAFGVAALAGLRLAPWQQEEDWRPVTPFFRWLATLAALTFAVPSIYMILANYRLTLFTGKNVYLLGLDSKADVLEALVLAVLFAVGAAAGRDAVEAS